MIPSTLFTTDTPSPFTDAAVTVVTSILAFGGVSLKSNILILYSRRLLESTLSANLLTRLSAKIFLSIIYSPRDVIKPFYNVTKFL